MKYLTLVVSLLFILNISSAISQTNSPELDTVRLQDHKESQPIGIWNAQMLIGNGFNYDRGVGFGVRGNFEFSNKIFTGVALFYHMGFPRSITVNGYGPSVFWGPEVGQRYTFSIFRIEVLCNAGQITYEEAPEYTPHFAQGTVSKFFYSPGVGITTRTETGSAGMHLRYIVVNGFNMWGVYFSIGI